MRERIDVLKFVHIIYYKIKQTTTFKNKIGFPRSVMAILQLRSRRKATGGRYKRVIVKRLARLGGLPTLTKVTEKQKSKTVRVIGGNTKDKLLTASKANLYDPETKKYESADIKNIVENPANRHYVRRNILTKGSIVETNKGKARITSRPGQSIVVNAILVK